MIKKIFTSALILMAVLCAITSIASCSKDDTEDRNPSNSDNAYVIIGEDGKASNGGIFAAIDDKNYYLDHIKYTVKNGHLAVSGYDKLGLKEIAKIVSRITYKGNTYEVLEIVSDAIYECTSLKDVFCYSINPPHAASHAFENTPITTITLHVPAGSVESYKSAEVWKKFGSIIAIE